MFQFNHVNSLNLIARAHQLVQEGYKYMFDEQLVTVWSAPNYCYRCGNMASIMTVHEDGSRSFEVYDAARENEQDKVQGRRLVRISCCYDNRLMVNLGICRPICHILYNSVLLCLYFTVCYTLAFGDPYFPKGRRLRRVNGDGYVLKSL